MNDRLIKANCCTINDYTWPVNMRGRHRLRAACGCFGAGIHHCEDPEGCSSKT